MLLFMCAILVYDYRDGSNQGIFPRLAHWLFLCGAACHCGDYRRLRDPEALTSRWRVITYLCGAAAGAAPLFAIHLTACHTWSSFYYRMTQENVFSPAVPLKPLAAIFFSPSRGQFVFSPFLLRPEGFGCPMLRSLSYGHTVVARYSESLLEIAAHYRGPGRLVAFRSEAELVEMIGRLLRCLEVKNSH
jgi:hypothetical protein